MVPDDDIFPEVDFEGIATGCFFFAVPLSIVFVVPEGEIFSAVDFEGTSPDFDSCFLLAVLLSLESEEVVQNYPNEKMLYAHHPNLSLSYCHQS